MLEPGASWTLPAASSADANRVLYVFDGGPVRIGGTAVDRGHAAVLGPVAAPLAADGPTECLLLQGRPIGEPVAQYGPFVMNTRAEIAQAFDDYERTRFGGWPWPGDDPVHGRTPRRFARHADGREEERPLVG